MKSTGKVSIYVWSHISAINNSSGLGPYQVFVSYLSSHWVLFCQELANTMLTGLKYVLGGVNYIKAIALKTSEWAVKIHGYCSWQYCAGAESCQMSRATFRNLCFLVEHPCCPLSCGAPMLSLTQFIKLPLFIIAYSVCFRPIAQQPLVGQGAISFWRLTEDGQPTPGRTSLVEW